MRKTAALTLSLLTLLLSACQLEAVTPVPSSAVSSPTQSLPAQNEPAEKCAPNQETRLTALYPRILPGVVVIRVETELGDTLGSGFVYDAEGHIVTNRHVIEGAEGKIEVDFFSGYKTFATLVGADSHADIALLKVNAPAEELHPLPLGNSDTLQVGQSIAAIGNPFGFTGSMTLGIISALGRVLPPSSESAGEKPFSMGALIQTDAALNPGNSGGPLFNLDGEVIGIARNSYTNRYSAFGAPANAGVAFAIPSNLIKRIVPILAKKGKYEYPYLGIMMATDLSLEDIRALGLSRTYGAYIFRVLPETPASGAGLRGGTRPVGADGLLAGGDLIVAIDGHPVLSSDDLLTYLLLYTSPGDTVTLTVLREEEELDIFVTLGKRP